MPTLDEAIAFVRAFTDDEHRALQARYGERDFLKFLMALKPVQGRYLKGLDANVDRSMNPGQRFWDEAPARLAGLTVRPVYAVSRHPTASGDRFAAYVGNPEQPLGVFQRLWLDERDGSLKIVAREARCTTCGGTGTACADCSAGWQPRAGGERVGGVGRATEVRRLDPSPPEDADLLASV